MCTWALSLGGKWLGREVEYCSPTSAEIKNGGAITQLPPHDFISWCLINLVQTQLYLVSLPLIALAVLGVAAVVVSIVLEVMEVIKLAVVVVEAKVFIILLLLLLTANGFSPGGSGTTIRQQTKYKLTTIRQHTI
jgi:hypothetical protein